ncbi:lipoyl protein ligase domain-containing protein, partial [Streptococcus suis]
GLASIGRAGYSAIIRSCGGLAVVADEGILNVTLILPNPDGHKVDLRESYQVMVDLIAHALSVFRFVVVSGEVATSYFRVT